MNFNEFVLMRHSYDDHSYIDGKNDTSLTSDGIKIAEDASEKLLEYLDNRKIVVRYSSKKRAKETAEILCEKLYKQGYVFNFLEDKNLIELFQGKLDFGNMKHEDRVEFLQSCWDDFENCRQMGNLKHNFGENKDRGVVLHPGENHQQWSQRVGNAVLNIIHDLKDDNQVIGITHRGATFEIQNIIKMANGEISASEVELYKTVWMKYCQENVIKINNLNHAETRVQKFVEERSI